MAAIDVLGALALAGTLGAAGQAVRAVGGLKKMSDQARASGVGTFENFQTSRFVISLIVGFVAGMVAALSLGLSKLMAANADNTELFLGLAAAGYGGTDFLEAFARRLTGAGGAGAAQSQVQLVAPPQPSPVEEPAASVPVTGDEEQPRPRSGHSRRRTRRRRR